VYVFRDFNRQYAATVLQLLLIPLLSQSAAAVLLLATGTAPSTYPLVLGGVWLLSFAACTYLASRAYVSGLQLKHMIVIALGMAMASAAAWVSITVASEINEEWAASVKTVVLSWIIVSLCLLHLPFLIVHVFRRL
jgi:hypothetical protein